MRRHGTMELPTHHVVRHPEKHWGGRECYQNRMIEARSARHRDTLTLPSLGIAIEHILQVLGRCRLVRGAVEVPCVVAWHEM